MYIDVNSIVLYTQILFFFFCRKEFFKNCLDVTDMLVVLATFIIDFVLGFLAEVNYGRYVNDLSKSRSTI